MLSSIVIVSKNNVIGCNGNLVFNIKEDLKRFKELTTNHKVIMGRKTFESLPFVLPNRHSIILTSNKNYSIKETNEKVSIIHDINEIINNYSDCEEEVFLVGGGTLYSNLMDYTSKLYITNVDKEVEGDTFFPDIDLNKFKFLNQSEKLFSETEQCNYSYIEYTKK